MSTSQQEIYSTLKALRASTEALGTFNKAFEKPIDKAELAKAGITTASNIINYDLTGPAKSLVPATTILRNSLPRRVMNKGGTITNYKVITALNTSRLRGGVPEGRRNQALEMAATDKSAAYKTIGFEDTVTEEAVDAAVGFEDVRATTVQRGLWSLFLEEEKIMLFGNCTVELGTPTAPTTATATSGGTIAAATYNVAVVALTGDGDLASDTLSGVATTTTVTPVSGQAFTRKMGSSNKSATTAQITTGTTSTISASTPVVTGAVAYAWYVGTAGNEKLEAITYINSVKLTALAGTGQALSAITADNSKDTYEYDGLLYQAWATAGLAVGVGSYIYNMPTGTPGVGTGLTATASGSIQEFDTAFFHFYTYQRAAPTAIYVSAQEAINIAKKVLAAGNVKLDYVSGQDGVAGTGITQIFNPLAKGTSAYVPLIVHPDMPPGTILFATDNVPYPLPNTPGDLIEIRLQKDYFATEWPQTTRQAEIGNYFRGVLIAYHPATLGIITNVANV